MLSRDLAVDYQANVDLLCPLLCSTLEATTEQLKVWLEGNVSSFLEADRSPKTAGQSLSLKTTNVLTKDLNAQFLDPYIHSCKIQERKVNATVELTLR